jgi:uncharacterized membrane protein YjjP (DUF1212 family)
MTLLFLAVYYGPIDRSLPLAIFALITGMVGLGFDLWVRSSPTQLTQVIHAPKHPLALNVVFFGVMAALLATLIRFYFFLDTRWNWRRRTFSIAFPIVLLVCYNLVILAVRNLRMKKQNSTNS